MDEHIIRSRPVIVTEEKLRESEAKQARQKALREALDLQILEAEKVRQEARRIRGAPPRRSVISPTRNAAPRSPRSPYLPPKPQLPQQQPSSQGQAPPKKPTAGSPAPVARYVMSFDDGNAFFEEATGGPSIVDTTQVPSDKQKDSYTIEPPQALAQVKVPASGKKVKAKPGFKRPSVVKGRRSEYETNSLPVDFALYNAAQPTHSDDYDVASLPVDLIYKLSARKVSDAGTPPMSATPADRRKRSPSGAGLYGANKNGKINNNNNNNNNVNRRGGPRAQPGKAGGVIPSTHAKKTRTPSPRRGNGNDLSRFLPPLVTVATEPNTSRAQDEVIEMSGLIEPDALPQQVASPAKNRGANANQSPDVQRLKKRLENQDVVLKKMAEKEKGWEEQVRRLKEELRTARRKKQVSGALTPLTLDPQQGQPRRAETAPENGPPVKPLMAYPPVASSAVPARRPPQHPDFSRAHIFSRQTFNPVHVGGRELLSPRTDAAHAVDRTMPPDDDEGSLFDGGLNSPHSTASARDSVISLEVGFEHLKEFVDAQLITLEQAQALWAFFRESCAPVAMSEGDPPAAANTVPVRGEAAGEVVVEIEVHSDADEGDDEAATEDHHQHQQRQRQRQASEEDESEDDEEESEAEEETAEEEEEETDNDDDEEADEEEEAPRGDYMQVPVSAHNVALAPGLRQKITNKYHEHNPHSPKKTPAKGESPFSSPTTRSPRMRRLFEDNGESNSSTPVGDAEEEEQILLHNARR